MSQDWYYYNHSILSRTYPHQEPDLSPINDGSIWKIEGGRRALLARWTTDFDCKEETGFWYIIKDDEFDINALKAKRRYEINKGNKNFEVRVVVPSEYSEEIYKVYTESLKGYSTTIKPMDKRKFETIIMAWSKKECIFFAAFCKQTGEMCGYADVWDRERYLPISSLKTKPHSERNGVNFALVYAIIQHFASRLAEGCYLCDGARNVLHQTNFQDFLIKYFGFRKAYCHLNILYKPFMRFAVKVLMPLKKLIGKLKNEKAKMVYSILQMESWKYKKKVKEQK